MNWRAWIPATWTASQRGVLIGFVGLLLVILVVRASLNRAYVSDPQPEHPPAWGDLADRIDPNTADWPTLAALPGIGPQRARAIVAYREAFLQENPGAKAFTRIEDLTEVHGIGYAISTSLRPYLVFPDHPVSDGAEQP